MTARTKTQTVECLNPNTGRKMNINKQTYDLFSKAIYHTLKEKGPVSFTEMLNGVYECFKKQKINFEGTVEWFTVSVKNDMHARGVIDVYMEKGKKLHQIK